MRDSDTTIRLLEYQKSVDKTGIWFDTKMRFFEVDGSFFFSSDVEERSFHRNYLVILEGSVLE
jgi:hypothetical protein